jgi:hypothetical protein
MENIKERKYPSESHWIESLSNGDLFEFKEGVDPLDGRRKLLARFAWATYDQLPEGEKDKVLRRDLTKAIDVGKQENMEVVMLPW